MSQIYETQSIKRKIEQEFTKLANGTQDQENTLKNILTSLTEQEQEIYLSPEIKQSFLYTIAGYQVAHDERKVWHLYHAIMLIYEIPRIQTILTQKYGKERINILRQQLYNYSKTINQIKIYLDNLDQTTLKNNDVNNPYFKQFINNLTKLPMIYTPLYQIYNLICTHTDIGKLKVPNTILAIVERQYKKVDTYQNNPNKPNIPDRITRE